MKDLYSVKVFNTRHHTHGHFTAVSRCFSTRIKRSPETFTDLPHSSFQLVTLEENYEYRFVDFITLKNKIILISLAIYKCEQTILDEFVTKYLPMLDLPGEFQSLLDVGTHFLGRHATACAQRQESSHVI